MYLIGWGVIYIFGLTTDTLLNENFSASSKFEVSCSLVLYQNDFLHSDRNLLISLLNSKIQTCQNKKPLWMTSLKMTQTMKFVFQSYEKILQENAGKHCSHFYFFPIFQKFSSSGLLKLKSFCIRNVYYKEALTIL